MTQYALSWSGGKDSALALYHARKAGIDVSTFLSVLTQEGVTACNRIPLSLAHEQARAAGVRLLTATPDWEKYEEEFVKLLGTARSTGVEGCVFGDIDIAEHREWGRQVCARAGIQAYHPLWGRQHEDVMDEFLKLGFEAVIVVVDLKKLDEGWLGRRLDRKAVVELAALGVSVAGEFGEYHTLVTAAPVFAGGTLALGEFPDSRNCPVIARNGYAFLDLAPLLARSHACRNRAAPIIP